MVRLFRRRSDPPAEQAAEAAELSALMRAGTRRARGGVLGRLGGALRRGAADEEFWEELEEILIGADVGVRTTASLIARLRRRAEAERARDPAALRALLRISKAAEDLGDQACQMVWLVEKGEDVHPILEIALGDSDEVVVDYPVAAGAAVEGRSLGELGLNIEPGFTVLTILRGERYLYRPRGPAVLQAGDEVIASGPEEGRGAFAALLGWTLERDPESGTDELSPRAGLLGARA